MVAGYPFNAWGKFDSFAVAAKFVYGDGWANSELFVHWGPGGWFVHVFAVLLCSLTLSLLIYVGVPQALPFDIPPTPPLPAQPQENNDVPAIADVVNGETGDDAVEFVLLH